jgi:hypothetical protein
MPEEIVSIYSPKNSLQPTPENNEVLNKDYYISVNEPKMVQGKYSI